MTDVTFPFFWAFAATKVGDTLELVRGSPFVRVHHRWKVHLGLDGIDWGRLRDDSHGSSGFWLPRLAGTGRENHGSYMRKSIENPLLSGQEEEDVTTIKTGKKQGFWKDDEFGWRNSELFGQAPAWHQNQPPSVKS